ncbi:MAG: hypothetical protein GX352_00905 [Clostridiales bacterium]|nr:hypothetical protein [Clostridiales bacterium]
MKNNRINMVLAIVLACLFLILIPGCNKIFKEPDKKQTKKAEDQKKSPPKTLTTLEKTTLMMIEDIQKAEDELKEQMQKKQTGQQAGKKGSEGGNQKGDAKQQGEDNKQNEKKKQNEDNKPEENGKKEEQKDQDEMTLKIDWAKMEKQAEKLQHSWNNYVNTASKDGISAKFISGYEAQLDTLTTKVMDKNDEALLEDANDLYKYYPKFFDLYKHQAPPNIKDMKYYIRKIIIDSEKEQWSQKDESIDALNLAWETAKSRMEKPDRELNKKIETAISSFTRSVNQKNKYLIRIKGDILMKNLEEIK